MSRGDCVLWTLHGQKEGSVGIREKARPRQGRGISAPTLTKAECGARVAVWLFAGLVWLMLATEARADAGSASSDGASAAVDTKSSGGPDDDPALEGTPPVAEPVEEPAGEPPVDPAPLPEPLPPEPPPADEGAATDRPPAETPPPVGETPPPEPQPPPPPVEPSPAPEPPVVTPPPEVPVAEPPPPVADPVPVEPPPATGSHGESIVTIAGDSSPPPPPPPLLPLLFPSDVGGGLIAVTWAGDRLDRQSGSRSETRNDGPRAAGGAGTAPLPPPLPFNNTAPSGLFVSTGAPSGGSSGAFFVGVLAALIALLAVAVQLFISLVSLRLAPPRGNAFALRLIRPG
jgi:hypothetical protein